MPTLKNSNPGHSEVFTCPSNKGVEIVAPCPISHCPYHASRLENIFDVKVDSCCGLHEPELQGAPSLATLQKSDIKKVSATTLRTSYNQAMEIIKTKLSLVNEIPNDVGYCENCGKIHDDYNSEECKLDRKWTTLVLNYYGLQPNAFRRAIIWKLLRESNLFLPKKLQTVNKS